ncbi:hypothetical protein MMC07_005908 [Pseudocyphellaria aurata]|nr:hypothetical protein [Pseudocyphellaria aurata]
MLNSQESIAIAELVLYPFVLVAIIFVLIRHGTKTQTGFVLLASFTVVRLVGAGFGIAAVKNPTKSNITWAAILQAVGLSPLIMSSAALLKRVIDQTSTHVRSDPDTGKVNSILPRIPIVGLFYRMINSRATASARRSRVIQTLQFGVTIAFVLFIVGATRETSSSSSKRSSGQAITKAGLVVLVAMYVILVLLAAMSASEFDGIPAGEKRILVAVLLAMPLLAVRVLWSILSVFTHIHTFSGINGSAAARVCMAVLEEFIIVVMYTLVGLTTSRYDAPEDAMLEAQIPLSRHLGSPPNSPHPTPQPTQNSPFR